MRNRMLAVDENGKMVDGDQLMAICGNYMKEKGTLKKNTIVVTVMTNLGFTLMGEEKGIHVEKTRVGDRYVLENMLQNGYNIGGEQSGHIIFLDDNTTGDGLLSALHLLQVMVETGRKLSDLAAVMEVLPQALVNAKVPNHKKDKFMEYAEISDAIKKVEERFGGEGRMRDLYCIASLHKIPAGLKCSPVGFVTLTFLLTIFTLLSVLGACVKSGDEIEFTCEGEDEEAALQAMVDAVNSGLGE